MTITPTIYNTTFAQEFGAIVLRHKQRKSLDAYIKAARTIDDEVTISDGDSYIDDKHVILTFFTFADLSSVCIETGFGHFCAIVYALNKGGAR